MMVVWCFEDEAERRGTVTLEEVISTARDFEITWS